MSSRPEPFGLPSASTSLGGNSQADPTTAAPRPSAHLVGGLLDRNLELGAPGLHPGHQDSVPCLAASSVSEMWEGAMSVVSKKVRILEKEVS